jgi:hypothetical protein
MMRRALEGNEAFLISFQYSFNEPMLPLWMSGEDSLHDYFTIDFALMHSQDQKGT